MRETGYEKGKFLGLASTEERRICSDKEPSLCRRTCVPGRFMLEIHLTMPRASFRGADDERCIMHSRSTKEFARLFRVAYWKFIFLTSLKLCRQHMCLIFEAFIPLSLPFSVNNNFLNSFTVRNRMSTRACIRNYTWKYLQLCFCCWETLPRISVAIKRLVVVVRHTMGSSESSIDLVIKQAIFYRARGCVS